MVSCCARSRLLCWTASSPVFAFAASLRRRRGVHITRDHRRAAPASDGAACRRRAARVGTSGRALASPARHDADDVVLRRLPAGVLEVLFEREVRGVGRDDAVARAEVNYLVGQLLLLAVGAYLLHQPADAARRPQARQEVVALAAQREAQVAVDEGALAAARPARRGAAATLLRSDALR